MRHRLPIALAISLALLAGACASSHPVGATKAPTVTGTVVSFADSSMTVETASGRQVILIAATTAGRDNLMVGANVAVDVQHGSGGSPVAARIRPASG